MPKRIPTPPPGDDEPRYMTVCYPYPPHANFEQDRDVKHFIYWISFIIGAENLFALFHKPTAPNMVIIEINRGCTGFDKLLGCHEWKLFLKNPSAEELERRSRVYWCTRSTSREVEKAGWKRKNVNEAWFKDYNSFVTRFQSPYPITSWCDAPPNSVMGHDFCRPIPRVEPVVPAPRPAVVGSAAWVKAKPEPSKVGNKTKSSAIAAGPKVANKTPPTARPPTSMPAVKSYASVSNSKQPPLPLYTAPHPHASNLTWGKNVNVSPASHSVSLPLTTSDRGSASSISSTSASPKSPDAVLTDQLAKEIEVLDLEAPEGQDDVWNIKATHVAIVPAKFDPDEDAVESYQWGGSDDEDAGKKVIGKPAACPHHGVDCRRGICTTMQKMHEEMEANKKRPLPASVDAEPKLADDDDGDFTPVASKSRGGGGPGRRKGGKRW